ncbi:hypothetical protein C2869_11600 [Saccharobesus litoralis]|uniref:Recombinase RecA n=1 Tax=Saccharobesus litoralis TaxID=2172099 RepID=A0A2S0VS47_9ALTE|nr:hypothetical protein [Saccharobesus litoralis]AWB67038.1 hypothetical protein C2869_11600 [Saccharobesus litoralis]
MDPLEQLKNQNLIWQGLQSQRKISRIASQYPELDEKLQGGLPEQGVIQIDSVTGIGELRLFIPYLKHKQNLGLIVFVNPPNALNAEFFVQQNIDLQNILIVKHKDVKSDLWCVEQCLKSGCCATVCYWGSNISQAQARRYMLATESQNTSLLLFAQEMRSVDLAIIDSPQISTISLPITLKINLTPSKSGLWLQVIKQKGGQALTKFHIDYLNVWADLYIPNTNQTLIAEKVALQQRQQLH